jgi:hypothetical protein
MLMMNISYEARRSGAPAGGGDVREQWPITDGNDRLGAWGARG